MKWMIASDIHGSAFFCRKLVERYHEEKADRLLLLGDILYHGPRNDLPEGYAPMETAALLKELRGTVFSVRGNCEAEIDEAELEFPSSAEYALVELGGRLVFVTHGHVYNERHLPPLCPGDILLHGHTHVPVCRTVDGILIINPGSVSIPKEGSAHSYMTCEDGLFIWKDLNGAEFMRCEV